MKNLYRISILGIAIITISVFYLNINDNLKKNKVTELCIANIEALASGESDAQQPMDCFSSIQNTNDGRPSETVTYCGDCQPIRCTHWYNDGRCMR